MTRFANDLPLFKRNLHAIYARRTEADNLSGLLWYEMARVFCQEAAIRHHYRVGTVAAVTAALSPLCRWERNTEAAEAVLLRQPVSWGPLSANVRKARVLRDNQLTDTRVVFKNGPKVYAFSQNLMGDAAAVTVDTHAIQAAYDDVCANVALRASGYEVFASAYREVALQLQLAPCDFQAIIWHTWKRENPHKQAVRAQWSAIGEW